MKRTFKARSDPPNVTGPVPNGTVLYALLDLLAGRVVRQLSATGSRETICDRPDLDEPGHEQLVIPLSPSAAAHD